MKRADIKLFFLRAMVRMDGQPMPESVLIDTAMINGAFMPRPTQGDAVTAIRELEADGYVAGTADELTEQRFWVLTTKGKLRAQS